MRAPEHMHRAFALIGSRQQCVCTLLVLCAERNTIANAAAANAALPAVIHAKAPAGDSDSAPMRPVATAAQAIDSGVTPKQAISNAGFAGDRQWRRARRRTDTTAEACATVPRP